MSARLKPGETCMFCGHARPLKKAPRGLCPDCGLPFTKTTPWRVYRGKRRHKACIAAAQKTPTNPTDNPNEHQSHQNPPCVTA